jgi:hypothetical protein
MAGEIKLNGTTALTESAGAVTLNNVDSATNRTNLGLGSAATSASTAFASSSTTITAGTGLSGGGDLSANRTVSVDYASTSEVQGTHTTFSGSHSDTATTINLASVSGITAGDYVVGEGITPGTTVSSVGASSVVISAGLDTDSVGIGGGEPISFYKADKVLSPGLVAGGLCRAWVNFTGTGTVAIQASHNVASITDNGLGDYTITFATAMPDNDYAISGTVSNTANNWVSYAAGADRGVVGIQQKGTSAPTTSSVRIETLRGSNNSYVGELIDFSQVTIAIFR